MLVGKATPRFSNTYQTFEVTLESAVQLRSALEAAGVRVPVSGRLNEYIRQLSFVHEVARRNLPDRFDLGRLHRAIAEIGELHLILEQLAAPPAISGWTRKAHLAMKGDIRPADERRNSSARDYQFELFVAAVFRRAGYELTLDEPDVLIRTEEGPIGIAAKRPRSWSNFDSLMRRADAQIQRSGHQGIIALDVSYLTNPADEFVPSAGDRAGLKFAGHAGADSIMETVEGFINNNYVRMLSRVHSEHTMGVIVYGSILGIDLAEPRLSVARASVFGNFCSLQDPRLRLFTNIRNKVEFLA